MICHKMLQIFFVIICCKILAVNSAKYYLYLSSDSPVILDSNITFNARITADINIKGMNFSFKFWDNLSPGKNGEVTVQKDNAKIVFNYDSKSYQAGSYVMKAAVYNASNAKLATTSCHFNLTNGLNGNLLIFQDHLSIDKDSPNISTSKVTEIKTVMYDPEKFLDRATLKYNFSVNNHDFPSSNESTIYWNITKVGTSFISVSVTAEIRDFNQSIMFYKNGFFTTQLEGYMPIQNIDIKGNQNLQGGELLNLSVTCNGTGEWTYCWSIKPKSFKPTGHEMCETPGTKYLTCSFYVIWYFSEPGQRNIFIQTMNRVSNKSKLISINVSDLKTNNYIDFYLSITPILTVTLCTVGIIYGLIILKRTLNNLTLDDNDDINNENLRYMTFVERVRTSFANLYHGQQPPYESF